MPIFERMPSLSRSLTQGTWKRSADRLKSKRGQTLVEYALILAFISVVAISVLAAMGNQVSATYTTINQQMTLAGNGGAGPPARTH